MKQKLNVFACLTFACALLIPARACYAGEKGTDSPVNKAYYTAVNIWVEEAGQIFTTNFHRGTILPINTKVKIAEYSGKGFSFTDGKGTKYKIVYMAKHSNLPVKEVFQRYFSEKEIPLGKFTREERKNIEAGTIAVGMSKDAVIAAYGYPPSHQTPSLEGKQWKYWQDRVRNFLVLFDKDNKVEVPSARREDIK